MNHCLMRLTQNDYPSFRKAYSKFRYSFFENDKGNQEAVALACMYAAETSTRTIDEFLSDVKKTNREMYFFQVDGETQGYLELIFDGKVAFIYEFVVFVHGKGWGTILYGEAEKIIKAHKCVKIELWCPYEGAQIFWGKKGFKPFYRNQTLLYRKKVR